MQQVISIHRYADISPVTRINASAFGATLGSIGSVKRREHSSRASCRDAAVTSSLRRTRLPKQSIRNENCGELSYCRIVLTLHLEASSRICQKRCIRWPISRRLQLKCSPVICKNRSFYNNFVRIEYVDRGFLNSDRGACNLTYIHRVWFHAYIGVEGSIGLRNIVNSNIVGLVLMYNVLYGGLKSGVSRALSNTAVAGREVFPFQKLWHALPTKQIFQHFFFKFSGWK